MSPAGSILRASPSLSPAETVEEALHGAVAPEQLEFIAFNGDAKGTYELLRAVPQARRAEYLGRHVCFQALRGCIDRCRAVEATLRSEAEPLLAEARREARALLDEFLAYCRQARTAPVELFQAIEAWCEYLLDARQFPEVETWCERARAGGVGRFPALRLHLMIQRAVADMRLGRLGTVRDTVALYTERPYLISDRDLSPSLLDHLAQLALHAGDAASYRRILWLGLRVFHTDEAKRVAAVERLVRVHRGGLRALVMRGPAPFERMLFVGHWLANVAGRSALLRLLRLPQALRHATLSVAFFRDYGLSGNRNRSTRVWTKYLPPAHPARADPFRGGILVTRAMGGIGDILMMTPGLRALARRHAPRKVYFATQRGFLPLFDGNLDVVALDIEGEPLPLPAFRRWYDLTDCPAARVESRTVPNVRRNRIDIFARAIGISRARLWATGRIPVYAVSAEEAQFAREFVARHAAAGGPRIAVHLHSADTYKDYLRMPELVEQLAQLGTVFLFHGEPIAGFDIGGVVKVDSLPLRRAIAVAAECDLVIAPDSAFVHVAAALGRPVLALFGPTDGRVFTRRYPLAWHLDARKELACVPCWRNESIACALTQGRRSACMGAVAPETVVQRARRLLERPSPRWWRRWLP